MSSTPQLLIVQAGLAVASQATPTGPFVGIVGFSIGSGFGYIPQITDTGLNGALLYSGVPTSYNYAGDGTIDIMCVIPADAGPFSFGEVALYLAGGVMFAKAVFDTLQVKYSSLGTNVASTYTFNCLLKLQQGPAVISVTTDSGIPPAVWEVDKWSDVYPPNLSANPAIPMIIVRELSPILNDATLLIQSSSTQWTISSNYEYLQLATVVNGTNNYVEAVATAFPTSMLNTTTEQLVLRFSDGYMRSINSVIVSGLNYRFIFNANPLLNPPVVGSIFDLFVVSSNTTPYVQNGTGANQLSNVVKVGLGSDSKLHLSIDSTDYGINWPVNVTGVAGTLANGANLAQPMQFSFSALSTQPTYLWGGSTVAGGQAVFATANLSVATSVNAGYATNAGTATLANNVQSGAGTVGSMNFQFSPNGTQPTYMWGGNTLATQFLFATASLSVSYATNANYATTANICNTGIGNGQSWQNVSRAGNTTYYNTTGRTICVATSADSSSGGSISANAYVNGVLINSYNAYGQQYNNGSSFFFIVPNNCSYSFNIGGSNWAIPHWTELR